MTRCYFYLDPKQVPDADRPGELHVLLYSATPPREGAAAIGNQVRDLLVRFGVQPSSRAVDLVSIALAVTAADRFVRRDETDTGWSRDLHISMPLNRPDPWIAVCDELSKTLNFLSGDTWTFEFATGGEEPPAKAAVSAHQKAVDVTAGDLVSLFSGGLDSTIYALSAIERGERPILMSHGYTGDQQIQNEIASKLPKRLEHVSVNAWPTSSRTTEDSMRPRSFNSLRQGAARECRKVDTCRLLARSALLQVGEGAE